MASIESLIPLIYHEKQQEGSMLCAQHALNSLLQGHYFTAPDLSAIAHSLDALEHTYDEDTRGGTSTNMDDTGFFSVQVLENALQVWGLSLVRWRSEAMRPYQDHPHTQLAFILNQSQHWYTLRRFGRVSPNPSLDADPGDGHWFNLNSSLPAPERIGKLYLGMFLHQAEAEGYSVFAVVQTDHEAPLALPRSEADELAASIPESSAASYTSAPRASHSEDMEGFEDEDMELQAALQASLMGPAHDFADAPSFVPVTEYSGVRTPTQQTHFGYGALARQEIDDDSSDNDVEVVEAPPQPLDPVAESAARNRIIMERARRAQEAALREGYQEEAARVNAAAARRRQAGLEDDDDEMLRRAIAESEAMARAANVPQLTTGEEVDEDEEMADADDEPPVIPPRIPPAAFSAHRNYDDEDAELQAALKASLEGLPAGFKVPSPPPVVPPPLYRTAQPVTSIQQAPAEETSETDTESEAGSSVAAVPEETLSIEEIRRRRLARFGG